MDMVIEFENDDKNDEQIDDTFILSENPIAFSSTASISGKLLSLFHIILNLVLHI